MERRVCVAGIYVCTVLLISLTPSIFAGDQNPAIALNFTEIKAKAINNLVKPVALINVGKKNAVLFIVDRLANGNEAIVRLSLNAKGRARKYTVLHEAEGTIQKVDIVQSGKKAFIVFVDWQNPSTSPTPSDDNDIAQFMAIFLKNAKAKEKARLIALINLTENKNQRLSDVDIFGKPVRNGGFGAFFTASNIFQDNITEGQITNEGWFQRFDRNGNPQGPIDPVEVPNDLRGIEIESFFDVPGLDTNTDIGLGTGIIHGDDGRDEIFVIKIEDEQNGLRTDKKTVIKIKQPKAFINVFLFSDPLGLNDNYWLLRGIGNKNKTFQPARYDIGQGALDTLELEHDSRGFLSPEFQSELIFTDGFESGNVSRWSSTVPTPANPNPSAENMGTFIWTNFLVNDNSKSVRSIPSANKREQHIGVYALNFGSGESMEIVRAVNQWDLDRPFAPMSAIMKNNELWIVFSGTNTKSGVSRMFLTRLQ